ncbi:MAG: hypothetical protein ACT4ON_13170 [Bacteroidota bacterium]
MKEILAEIKTEFPRFFINLINIIASPRIYPLELLQQSKNKEEQALTKAFVYFILCNILMVVWLVPVYGHEKQFNSFNFIYSVLSPIIFLFLASLALKISWNIFGYKSPYTTYLIVFAYHGGTLYNMYLFTNFINLSLLKYLDPVKFKELIEWNYLKNSSINPNDTILSSGPYIFYSIFGLICLIGAFVWFYYSWNAYRNLNNASGKRSFLAAVIFTLLMIVVCLIDLSVQNAFKP